MRWRVGDRGVMRRSRRHLDEQLDRLLAGDPYSDMGDGITELVGRLRSDLAGKAPATELTARLALETREADGAPVWARSRTGRPLPIRWRRRIMLTTFISSLLGKLVIGSVALAATTGGLAATGNLPDPVQEWAAERLDTVGIEIPGPNDHADDTAKNVLDVIDNGDPYDGDQFGKDVADTASKSKSSEGLDNADNVVDVNDNGDPYDGEQLGKDVADTASNNKSSEGLDTDDESGDVDIELPDEVDEHRP